MNVQNGMINPTWQKVPGFTVFEALFMDLSNMVEGDVKYEIKKHSSVGNPALPEIEKQLLDVFNFRIKPLTSLFKEVQTDFARLVHERDNLQDLNSKLVKRLQTQNKKIEISHVATQVEDLQQNVPSATDESTQTCITPACAPIVLDPCVHRCEHDTSILNSTLKSPAVKSLQVHNATLNSSNSNSFHKSSKPSKIIIYAIDEKYSIPDIIQAISDTAGFTPSCNFIKKNKSRKSNKYNYIFEVPPDVAALLANCNTVKIDEQSVFVKRFIRIIRCYNCQSFNHVASSCKKSRACPWCAETHEPGHCTKPPKCKNCIVNNKFYKRNFNVDHPAFSPTCESFKLYASKVRLRLNSSFIN